MRRITPADVLDSEWISGKKVAEKLGPFLDLNSPIYLENLVRASLEVGATLRVVIKVRITALLVLLPREVLNGAIEVSKSALRDIEFGVNVASRMVCPALIVHCDCF